MKFFFFIKRQNSRATGMNGIVQVNGQTQSTSSENYRKLSCYIHQEDMLRSALTVSEIMMIAANLKLGYRVTHEYKQNLVSNIKLIAYHEAFPQQNIIIKITFRTDKENFNTIGTG